MYERSKQERALETSCREEITESLMANIKGEINTIICNCLMSNINYHLAGLEALS